MHWKDCECRIMEALLLSNSLLLLGPSSHALRKRSHTVPHVT